MKAWKVYEEYLEECDKIAEQCAEEGYPSHGSNYELRCEDLWDSYYKLEYENGEDVSAEEAKAFWKDLMGTLWGDPDCRSTHGIMSPELVADHMGISATRALFYLCRCCADDLHLTDRQGGAFAV